MKYLTSKKVRQYMAWRSKYELVHCPDCITEACNDIYDEYKNNEFVDLKSIDFMKLLFFNDPIKGLHTHSYGFNTANGRNIIEKLKERYYEYKHDIA
tara:strand:+ start:233 stop:523 length:291 start_codon:yes stop_codon:yes gene_type:complete